VHLLQGSDAVSFRHEDIENHDVCSEIFQLCKTFVSAESSLKAETAQSLTRGRAFRGQLFILHRSTFTSMKDGFSPYLPFLSLSMISRAV
jgi:hypothetical protein